MALREASSSSIHGFPSRLFGHRRLSVEAPCLAPAAAPPSVPKPNRTTPVTRLTTLPRPPTAWPRQLIASATPPPAVSASPTLGRLHPMPRPLVSSTAHGLTSQPVASACRTLASISLSLSCGCCLRWKPS